MRPLKFIKLFQFKVILWGCMVMSISQLHAQNYSNLRVKTIVLKGNSISIDTNSIVPQTISVYSIKSKVLLKNFQLDCATSTLNFEQEMDDSMQLIYRVFPFSLSQKKSSILKINARENKGVFLYKPYTEPNNIGLIDFDGLEYSGSFTRGITFGNSQSLALSSGFNLGLSGKTQNGIEISAQLSDANIPIQPDGNTAQLNEFDKIFIQVKKDNHKVIIGDYDLSHPANSYFLNFNKKLQGLQYLGTFPVGDSMTSNVHVAGAVTRGQFARNILAVQENNQGPYKLRGTNNELFLIVLANTERVFINGQLLQRGQDKDYTIDYNLGEIHFTPRRLITRDLRVVVEFQYSDKNYFRTTLYGDGGIQSKNISFSLRAITEQDNKNQPLNYTLDDSKRNVLESIGDQLNLALVNTSVKASYDGSRVLYKMVDTFVNAIHYDSIYRVTDFNDSNLYQVSFSFVGSNKGNYKVASSGANGRVYEWVAPLNNVLQGDYESIVIIVTPKSEQMISGVTQAKIGKHIQLENEVALSNKDLNTFSTKDDGDNVGLAIKSVVNVKTKTIQTKLYHEWVQDRFNFIQRFRSVEFSRDWDIANSVNVRRDEHFAKMEFTHEVKGFNSQLQLNGFLRDSIFKGIEPVLKLDYNIKNSSIQSFSRYMIADQLLFQTHFFRPQLMYSQSFPSLKGWKMNLGFNHEIKRTNYKSTDTLDASSFLWQNYKAIISSNDSFSDGIALNYIYRTEQLPFAQSFATPNIYSHTISANGRVGRFQNHKINYALTYRNFFNADTVAAKNELNNYYLGRIDYRGNYFKGFLKWNTQYEIGAGREQKVQFTYVKAPNGYGAFAWKDINGNGIFELNEAFVSQFNYENRYMKVYLNTPEFLPVNETKWGNVFNIAPKQLLKDEQSKIWWARLSMQTILDWNRKIFLDKNLSTLEYFSLWTKEQIIAQNSTLKNTLFINRDRSEWGLEYEYLYTTNVFLLSNGRDGRNSFSHTLRNRLKLGEKIIFKNAFTSAYKTNTSEFFEEKNFSFGLNNYNTKFIYQPLSLFRLEWGYDYKFQSTGMAQMAVLQDLSLEAKYSKSEKSTIDFTFNFIMVGYAESIRNAQVEFAMLNGIQKGNNFVWSLNINRKLSDLMNLNIVYQGRKNTLIEGFVHSLNAEIRAVF